ncbi:MAG: ATP-dependent helicase PcrA [Gemmatimonadetes bacterium]|nr:ATP-dependent helicase PcrA [Gemmatimonadota bacterium]
MSVDLSHLNPEQREATEHFEGPMLVLAGAGSGKTRVLTTRIAWLIDEQGVDPAQILSLTFTNKAAGEMRERIRKILGREPTGMWMGTFHAIGVRILRRDATRLGWAPNFMIYDAGDQESLVKRIVRDEMQLDPKRWPPKGFQAAISKAKNELTSVEAFQAAAVDVFEKKTAEVYERYQRALHDANAFDFDDLLVKPVELFRTHPHVLERYRDRFPFVLVDEYQDTNRAQYVLLQLLAKEVAPENLFVVGDDDQSIYGWRGADIRNILDFEKDFPTARTVRLERNYRSTKTILDAANHVIAQNLRRKGKTLRTEAAAGEALTLVEAADEADEAEWVAAEVRARMEDDAQLTLRDFVVLYRTNSQSRSMEEAFKRWGMPYRLIGGTRFYERREVKDALAYLRLVANPAADEAFLRVVNVPRRGIGDASVARLAEHASARRLSLLAAAEQAEYVDGIKGGAAKALPKMAALVRKHAALAERGHPLGDLLRDLVSEAGLLESLREEGAEGEERVENLHELIAGAADLESRLRGEDPELMMELEEMGETSPRAIDLFLAHVALVADVDQHDPDADAIPLMTMHNAKGLEFPFVFITGLEDGLFPHSRTLDEKDQMEEERRLFYVGITRAERKLYLAYARRRRHGRDWMASAPSRFLEDLPKDLLELRRSPAVERASPTYQRPWRSASSGLQSRSQRLGFSGFGSLGFESEDSPALRRGTPPPPVRREAADPSYQVDYSDSQEEPSMNKGARVRHPSFGPGTVVELTGVGTEVKAVIDFDSIGRKTLMLKYANLERDWD